MAINLTAEFTEPRAAPTRDIVDEICAAVRGVEGLHVDNKKVESGSRTDERHNKIGTYAHFPVEVSDSFTGDSVVEAVRTALDEEIEDFARLEKMDSSR